jgi:hypothetical protein
VAAFPAIAASRASIARQLAIFQRMRPARVRLSLIRGCITWCLRITLSVNPARCTTVRSTCPSQTSAGSRSYDSNSFEMASPTRNNATDAPTEGPRLALRTQRRSVRSQVRHPSSRLFLLWLDSGGPTLRSPLRPTTSVARITFGLARFPVGLPLALDRVANLAVAGSTRITPDGLAEGGLRVIAPRLIASASRADKWASIEFGNDRLSRPSVHQVMYAMATRVARVPASHVIPASVPGSLTDLADGVWIPVRLPEPLRGAIPERACRPKSTRSERGANAPHTRDQGLGLATARKPRPLRGYNLWSGSRLIN